MIEFPYKYFRQAQENNHKLELEIEKWEKYGEVGCKEHDLVIQNLERTIQTQVDNTLNMQKFIIKQIETAKSDSEEVIRQQEATRRERAMMDAVNALPGSLHEVRKSDQLQKLVEWQVCFEGRGDNTHFFNPSFFNTLF